MKVIYIAGLYHTGSTLLDLTLGNLPNVIGLGEIYKGLREGFEDKCSCGKSKEDCIFWGEINRIIEEQPDLDFQSKYELVISTFKKHFDEDFILVDSSKCHPFKLFPKKTDRDMQGLNYLTNMKDLDLKVIHMVRDVRSWSNGLQIRDERTKAELGLLSRIIRRLTRSASARFIQWYWGHKKIIRFLILNKIASIKISYEDLAIDPENTLSDLTKFLDMDYDPKMLIPSESKSHIVVGNPMRFRDTDIKKIKYDTRWFSSNRLFLPSMVLRPIMNFNKKLIYEKIDSRDKEDINPSASLLRDKP